MAEEFKQNEDVLNLARYLIAVILISIFIASIFGFLYLLLTPGSTYLDGITKNIWNALYVLSFLVAFFSGIYGLLLQLSKDDSNIIRVISLVYAVSLLAVLLAGLFVLFGFQFVNPIPFSI